MAKTKEIDLCIKASYVASHDSARTFLKIYKATIVKVSVVIKFQEKENKLKIYELAQKWNNSSVMHSCILC
jgi:soluble P-type ATPase